MSVELVAVPLPVFGLTRRWIPGTYNQATEAHASSHMIHNVVRVSWLSTRRSGVPIADTIYDPHSSFRLCSIVMISWRWHLTLWLLKPNFIAWYSYQVSMSYCFLLATLVHLPEKRHVGLVTTNFDFLHWNRTVNNSCYGPLFYQIYFFTSCKSVQPFSRNVADKETKKEIARKQYPVPLPG